MKKILILQMRPEDEAANSEFEAILNVSKIPVEQVQRIRLEQDANAVIDLNQYSAIIAGGSPFDVSLPHDKKSNVQNRIEAFFNRLFDRIIPLDFPFFGACSGNGLLGQYCGTSISGKFAETVGSVTVSLTPEAKDDDLLKGFPQEFLAFVGHKEACDHVPDGAVLLITSDPCPVQMFRISKNIYASQFHPEANEEEFILRINTYKNYGYFPPHQADQLIKKIRGIESPETNKILRKFVHKYHG